MSSICVIFARMIKDIPFLKVEDIGIAVVPGQTEEGDSICTAWLINFKSDDLHHIMVRCRGVGSLGDEPASTSTLRILLEKAPSLAPVQIDSFPLEATGLCNEYWISFRHRGYLYDKKYVFVPESIIAENFIRIPVLDMPGVMIK